MKIILIPLFKFIMLFVLLHFTFLPYIIYTILYFIWSFKILTWKEMFNNEKSYDRWKVYEDDPEIPIRYDYTPWDTIKRYWNLDFTY